MASPESQQLNPELLSYLFQEISNKSSNLFIIYDLKEEELLYVSPMAESLCKRKIQPFYNNPEKVYELIHPDDREFVVKNIINDKDSDEKHIDFRILDEKLNPIFIQAKSLRLQNKDEGKNILLIQAEDISNRKESEINLLDINEKKDATLQILAHDLRGPLSTIKLVTDLLNSNKGDKEEQQRLLGIVEETCDRAIHLINDLLSTEFHESEKVEFKRKRLNIIDRFHSIIQTYRLSETGRKKNFVIEPKETVYIHVDELKFMLIINNLISNAYKFTPEKGTITLSAERKKNTVLIKIADNGIGIPDDLKPKLFDKFTKSRRTGLQGERPVGLGMIIIKRLVKLHEGEIWFESKEGEGTTFYVEIPRYD
ncbi:MAG: ATP-binding protein [Candidatus Cyclobacteriaceae bacterium M2_1C_046]